MPNYRRADVTGATYFFTVNTHRRQPLLTHEPVRTALRDAIDHARSMLPFTIDAWVLLPDHLHCIWTLPPRDADFSKRWGIIKQRVTSRCREQLNTSEPLSASRQRRRESTFWQRRYWEHVIRDEADYKTHVDYIHWNPVKHGLVKKACDWPYSTFHRHVRDGTYTTDWGLSAEIGGEYGE